MVICHIGDIIYLRFYQEGIRLLLQVLLFISLLPTIHKLLLLRVDWAVYARLGFRFHASCDVVHFENGDFR